MAMELNPKKMLGKISIWLLILTPLINKMVNMSRDTPGIGGECFLWILPMIIADGMSNMVIRIYRVK